MATTTMEVSPTDAVPQSSLSSAYFEFPDTLAPLPAQLKRGMFAPGTLGVLSAACCIGMLLFVIYRFLTWRAHYRTFVGYNQYVVLIVNLLVADLLQGVSFMFSFHWIYYDGIFAPSRTCFSQAFLLNAGDLASGFFVLGIALHTFWGAVKGRHVKYSVFVVYVISSWAFALFLSGMGPITHGNRYYVRAGPWCWAAPRYEAGRLGLHYFWIFFVQFAVIIIYALIFLHLRNTLSKILPASQSATHAKVDRAAKLMFLFPLAYLIVTLPLSAGRMYTMSHHNRSLKDGYALAGGSMLASSGMIDCLLYTLTRRSLVKSNMHSSSSSSAAAAKDSTNGYDLSALNGITQTRTVTVTDNRLSVISDDDDAYSTRSTASSSSPQKKKHYLTADGLAHSPTGSLDPIVCVDPRKGRHTVVVSTTEAEGDEDLEAGRSVLGSERSTSPLGVRKGLARLAMISSHR